MKRKIVMMGTVMEKEEGEAEMLVQRGLAQYHEVATQPPARTAAQKQPGKTPPKARTENRAKR